MKYDEFTKLSFGKKVKLNGNECHVVRINKLTAQALIEDKRERQWVEYYKLDKA